MTLTVSDLIKELAAVPNPSVTEVRVVDTAGAFLDSIDDTNQTSGGIEEDDAGYIILTGGADS